MNALRELQDWYLSQCDGEWEHGYAVDITTLDNPGWSVTIHLLGTNLEGREFKEIGLGVGVDAREGNDDWFLCRVQDQKFEGRGSPEKLEEILGVFLKWKDAQSGSRE